jgi:hypothetical protein
MTRLNPPLCLSSCDESKNRFHAATLVVAASRTAIDSLKLAIETMTATGAPRFSMTWGECCALANTSDNLDLVSATLQ